MQLTAKNEDQFPTNKCRRHVVIVKKLKQIHAKSTLQANFDVELLSIKEFVSCLLAPQNSMLRWLGPNNDEFIFTDRWNYRVNDIIMYRRHLAFA